MCKLDPGIFIFCQLCVGLFISVYFFLCSSAGISYLFGSGFYGITLLRSSENQVFYCCYLPLTFLASTLFLYLCIISLKEVIVPHLIQCYLKCLLKLILSVTL